MRLEGTARKVYVSGSDLSTWRGGSGLGHEMG